MKYSYKELKKQQFLFEELVKRDFFKKYKRTSLGILWSMISPLATLLVMHFVFAHIFGTTIPHYTVYLFSGIMVFNYFADATTMGMFALEHNAAIIANINVPKYLFLVSKNISSTINFLLTLVIFMAFVFVDGLSFSWKMALLIYPVVTLIVFNIGVGLVLSVLFLFFKDMAYLYNIVCLMIMYSSAIFYDLSMLPKSMYIFFDCNPIYNYISYFRVIILEDKIPGAPLTIRCFFFAFGMLTLGLYVYRRYNYKFLYYI